MGAHQIRAKDSLSVPVAYPAFRRRSLRKLNYAEREGAVSRKFEVGEKGAYISQYLLISL